MEWSKLANPSLRDCRFVSMVIKFAGVKLISFLFFLLKINIQANFAW